jgi:hypothetical protein
MGTMKKGERRKELRIPEEKKISIKLLESGSSKSGGKKLEAMTRDVSLSGARIVCDRSIPKDTKLQVRLPASKGSGSLQTTGKVCWTRRIKNTDMCEIGLQFVDSPAEVSPAVPGRGDAGRKKS